MRKLLLILVIGMFLIGLSIATEYNWTETVPVALSSSGVAGGSYGWFITPTLNATLSPTGSIDLANVTKDGSSGATRVRVYNGTGRTSLLGTATIVGNIGEFTSPITLYEGVLYEITLDNSSSDYTRTIHDLGGGQPFSGDNIVWNYGASSTGTEDASNGYNIASLQFSTSSGELNVSLLSPTNNSNFINNDIDLIINITKIGGSVGITNVTRNIYWKNNGTLLNSTTNSSGIFGNYTFSKILPDGSFSWNVTAYDSYTKIYETETREFTIGNYTLNSLAYNTSTFETALETFVLNVTTDSLTISSGKLIYGGSTYSVDITNPVGNTYLLTKEIQTSTGTANNSFYFNFTMDGIEYSTSTHVQEVNYLYFGSCNATYSTTFLNVSFKDEGDLSFINATIPSSSFIYYLGDGTITKTLSFTNNTENYNYLFCSNGGSRNLYVNPYVQYKQGSSYPQRVWDIDTTTYTNSTTNQTLYLLSSTEGLYVTFQTINLANQVLSGVEIIGTRTIGSSVVEVAQGTTGADGTSTFWLNPDFEHTFNFTKTGFTSQSLSFAPTQTGYTITLSGESSSYNSTFRGIDYSVIPTANLLYNDTTYTFGFNLTSSYWDISDYGFNLRLANGTIIEGDSTGIEGTQLTKGYDTNNQTIIYMDYYWVINGNYTNGTRYWPIQNSEYTGWSIKNFFTDLSAYLDEGLFGLDNFGRNLIIFLIIFSTTGIMAYKYGLTNQMVITTVLFGVVFFFDVIVGIIPEIRGIDHLLTYFMGLALVLSVFVEVRRA